MLLIYISFSLTRTQIEMQQHQIIAGGAGRQIVLQITFPVSTLDANANQLLAVATFVAYTQESITNVINCWLFSLKNMTNTQQYLNQHIYLIK